MVRPLEMKFLLGMELFQLCTLKIMSVCTVGPLVEDNKKRACAKLWSVVKMREAGASTQQLATVYTALVRNGIEHGAQVYGCLLYASQS